MSEPLPPLSLYKKSLVIMVPKMCVCVRVFVSKRHQFSWKLILFCIFLEGRIWRRGWILWGWWWRRIRWRFWFWGGIRRWGMIDIDINFIIFLADKLNVCTVDIFLCMQFYSQSFIRRMSMCLFFCLSVPKDIANRWTKIVSFTAKPLIGPIWEGL